MTSGRTILSFAICAIVALIVAPNAGFGQSAPGEPQIVVLDHQTGKVIVNIYDRITFKDGKVLFANPKWSDGWLRPVTSLAAKLKSFKYVAYDKPQAGPIGLPPETIDHIDYWEDLALAEIGRLRNQNQLGVATELADRLLEFNPHWRDGEPRRSKAMVTLMYIEGLCNSSARKDIDEGTGLLEELMDAERGVPGVSDGYVRIYVGLARKVFDAGDYDEAERFAQQVRRRTTSRQYYDFNRHRSAVAAAVVAQAAKAAKNGESDQAMTLFQKACKAAPFDASVQAAFTAFLEEHQMLKVATYERPGTFEPFNALMPLERQLLPQVFDTLVEPDSSGRRFFKGPLVEKFRPLALGRQFEVELKKGLTFADGRPVTAHDVADTIKYMKDRRGEAFDAEWDRFVRGVKVQGLYTLLIELEQHPRPESLLEKIFVVPGSALRSLPQRASAFASAPTGTGPYVVTLDRAGNVRLKPNPKFLGSDRGQPYIKDWELKKYVKRGTGAAVNHLEQGQLHMISDPSPEQLVRLKNSLLFRTNPFRSDSVWCLVFNYHNPLFQKREAREAVALAIDQGNILRQYFDRGGGGHQVVSGPFPPHSPAYDTSVKQRDADPLVARKLVEQLGPQARKRLSLKYPNDGSVAVERAMDRIKKDLEIAGFDIFLDPKLPNDLIREVAIDHDFDIAYWRIDHNNILFNIANLFDTAPEAMKPGGSNFMGYSDPTLTQMFVDLRQANVGDEIWNTQHRIHRHIFNEVVLVPLWRIDNYVIHTKRLVGKTPDGKTTDPPIDSVYLYRQTEQWYLTVP